MNEFIPFARPTIGMAEIQAVNKILRQPILVHGKELDLFESEFARWVGAESAVAVSSCTAGLHLAYMALNISRGDEVIVPAMTHVATAHAIEFVGAKPIFVDCELTYGNIDISKIERKITKKTKAISVVHYIGTAVNFNKLKNIAEKYNLRIIEDCALAFGTKYESKHAGLIGDIGVFSLYPVKHITSLEGGLIISKHSKYCEKIKLLRAFGVTKTHRERSPSAEYDVTELGYNYRMNEVQAAIGRIQLKKLNKILEIRKTNYALLTESLNNNDLFQQLKELPPKTEASYYCKTVICTDNLKTNRNNVSTWLKNSGLGTSVYYPKPVPLLDYYKRKYGHEESEFPNAATIANKSIALPVGPHITQTSMALMIKLINSLRHESFK